MTTIEKKAREIVREAYFDYKLMREQKFYNDYATLMDMLKELFPKTTNQDTLEIAWDVMWKKMY